ncbi:MAG: DEAD/DEAH box helicase [Alphaproteobacteria bacterium]|nr:DEAD/DEAH box helicase [Alphaproteobacteria bacterium]MDD9919425.1 DEAD/DEAH box helicase [Alphaproteobacteria bacterium]
MTDNGFSSLGLHAHILKAITKNGFKTPTPVQAQSIPLALEGKDVLACAQTGTGKTAAFTLPAVYRLLSKPHQEGRRTPRVLILTPTRELANQVAENVRTFTEGTPLKMGVIVGGASYGPQIKMLKNSLDILVATPGRLIDHLQEGLANLSAVEVLVLDEADRMLDMGFLKPVERIFDETADQRQVLLFSATVDSGIERLAKKFMTDPVQVRLAAETGMHAQIEQSLFHTSSREHKVELLRELVSNDAVWQAIVFTKTKRAADRMAQTISGWGHSTEALHGDMRQGARRRVVQKMHKGETRILVATDVAARGIDVKDLSHVINFDLPQVAEDYVHRVGRTGRAGAKGTAVSLVSKDELPLLKDIEKLLGEKIESRNEAPAMPKTARPAKRGGKKKPFSFAAKRKRSNDRSPRSARR